jgi:uncharacterized repeat protein (TIGR01451 family)
MNYKIGTGIDFSLLRRGASFGGLGSCFDHKLTVKGMLAMKTLATAPRFFSSLLILFLVASVVTAFVGRPEVKVALTGTITRNNQMLPVEKAGLLHPGEILHWTITSHNDGTAPAHQYKTIGEIPSGTAYILGSAQADAAVNIVYSIDGGKTFTAKPLLEQKQPDGSLRKVAAPATMYTHIRYEWDTPLAEGKQLLASYKVRVK